MYVGGGRAGEGTEVGWVAAILKFLAGGNTVQSPNRLVNICFLLASSFLERNRDAGKGWKKDATRERPLAHALLPTTSRSGRRLDKLASQSTRCGGSCSGSQMGQRRTTESSTHRSTTQGEQRESRSTKQTRPKQGLVEKCPLGLYQRESRREREREKCWMTLNAGIGEWDS